MELPTLFRSLRPRRRLRPRLISLPLYHGRPCGKRIHNRGRRRKQSSLPFARQRAKAISPQTPAAGFPTLGSEPPTSSSNGRDARYHSLSVADEAVRTQRGLEESSAKTIRCKKRLRLIQRDIAEAESTNRGPCLVARNLEVVAVAGLLGCSWCVLGAAGFRVFSSFCFSSNAHGMQQA